MSARRPLVRIVSDALGAAFGTSAGLAGFAAWLLVSLGFFSSSPIGWLAATLNFLDTLTGYIQAVPVIGDYILPIFGLLSAALGAIPYLLSMGKWRRARAVPAVALFAYFHGCSAYLVLQPFLSSSWRIVPEESGLAWFIAVLGGAGLIFTSQLWWWACTSFDELGGD